MLTNVMKQLFFGNPRLLSLVSGKLHKQRVKIMNSSIKMMRFRHKLSVINPPL